MKSSANTFLLKLTGTIFGNVFKRKIIKLNAVRANGNETVRYVIGIFLKLIFSKKSSTFVE
jgi:hypothetical protein